MENKRKYFKRIERKFILLQKKDGPERVQKIQTLYSSFMDSGTNNPWSRNLAIGSFSSDVI